MKLNRGFLIGELDGKHETICNQGEAEQLSGRDADDIREARRWQRLSIVDEIFRAGGEHSPTPTSNSAVTFEREVVKRSGRDGNCVGKVGWYIGHSKTCAAPCGDCAVAIERQTTKIADGDGHNIT